MVCEAKGDAGSGTQGCGALNTDCGIETTAPRHEQSELPSGCGALNTDCGIETWTFSAKSRGFHPVAEP